ncbi:DUF1304 domain-containing protein [Streptococcus chenjunshii]|uniref:DUF1304 domain-containing protein n=1 Tax=Streptococcus chenjunshii TaxID=2173853 RepID=A0A372KLC2_9STRE|nr:DUF1304 domain-containing protein [Streptococcus chenjunshii]AXQ79646.1 DUF1304 domain-containing protein [Streptococcus chenjunshii]RFU51038.1 DUF1304 domain-containing protein [Streptococcus chenjunshii]RFU53082.1 DUF1304 domain-containing protein [Streptococcus chenjunshii]
MSLITILLATAVALEHFYIMYLETIATQSATTSRVFGLTEDELSRQSVSLLLKNQGIYNGLLGLSLLYALFISVNLEMVTVFVLFVIGAAVYGALSSSKKILLTQGGPALLALLSIFIFH